MVSEDFLRALWSRRLSAMTSADVIARPNLQLTELAEIVDRIQENPAQTHLTDVASVVKDTATEVILKKLEELQVAAAE